MYCMIYPQHIQEAFEDETGLHAPWEQNLNPSNAEATFLQSPRTQILKKTTFYVLISSPHYVILLAVLVSNFRSADALGFSPWLEIFVACISISEFAPGSLKPYFFEGSINIHIMISTHRAKELSCHTICR